MTTYDTREGLAGLVRREQLARIMGVTVSTIKRYENMGMPRIKMIGMNPLYDPVAIRDWILSRCRRIPNDEQKEKPGG